MLILPPEWEKLWADKDAFAQIFALQGQEYRNMDGRRTLRFELSGESYFVKMYCGLGWRRIIRNLLTFRALPITRAYNEWRAIGVLQEIGVETMTVVAYGERGISPACRQSFLVTRDLAQTESLEDFCRDWARQPPPLRLKRALIERIANMSHLLHTHGINHRDYYLCHFLLDVSNGRDAVDPDALHLYLIDLHRVQLRNRLPYRWRLKDLCALYFSSLEIGLTMRDYYRFLRRYYGISLREVLNQHEKLLSDIVQRGTYLQKRFDRKFRE